MYTQPAALADLTTHWTAVVQTLSAAGESRTMSPSRYLLVFHPPRLPPSPLPPPPCRCVVAAGRWIAFWQLLNEPWPGDVWSDPLLLLPGVADGKNLQPLFANLTAVIRAAEAAVGSPPHLIQWDTVTWDDFVPTGFTDLTGECSSRPG